MSNPNRPFAIEEAYVSIYEEYSPFYCPPVFPRSRTFNKGLSAWALTYDLSLYPADLVLAGRPTTLIARWKDIYMTNLKWDKKPVTTNQLSSGLPGEYVETTGFSGSLSFDAAHFGDFLWEMTGWRRFWRIFVDIKSAEQAPVERSWEFRGCSVDGNSWGGSPVSVSRSFNVREVPEGDSLYTLDPNYRNNLLAYKYVSGTTVETIPLEAILVQSSRYANLLNGQYNLNLENGSTANTYKITYNGYPNKGAPVSGLDNIVWKKGKQITIDGYEGGRLTFQMLTDAPTIAIGTKLTDILVIEK